MIQVLAELCKSVLGMIMQPQNGIQITGLVNQGYETVQKHLPTAMIWGDYRHLGVSAANVSTRLCCAGAAESVAGRCVAGKWACNSGHLLEPI